MELQLTAARLRLDKKCGKSGIPDNKKCGKKTSPSTITKVALGAGAIAGIAALGFAARRRWGRRDPNWKGFSTPGEDWDRIEAEARQGGKKWNVFEENKKNLREACAAQGIQNFIADGFTRFPAACSGNGAFGNYIVHPSEKYGLKYNRSDDGKAWSSEQSITAEAEAHKFANDIGVPAPKLFKASDKVMVMEHLPDHEQLSKMSFSTFYGVGEDTPLIVKRGMHSAYKTMHTNGLIHNDAHSNNILYNPKTYDLRIIDFGLANFVHEPDAGTFLREEMSEVPYRIGLSPRARREFDSRWNDKLDIVETRVNSGNFHEVLPVVKGFYNSLYNTLEKDHKALTRQYMS
jgi:hypothetical protein